LRENRGVGAKMLLLDPATLGRGWVSPWDISSWHVLF